MASLSSVFAPLAFRDQIRKHLLCRGDWLQVMVNDYDIREVNVKNLGSLSDLYRITRSFKVAVAIRELNVWVGIDNQVYRPWFIDTFGDASGYTYEDREEAIATCAMFNTEPVVGRDAR